MEIDFTPLKTDEWISSVWKNNVILFLSGIIDTYACNMPLSAFVDGQIYVSIYHK